MPTDQETYIKKAYKQDCESFFKVVKVLTELGVKENFPAKRKAHLLNMLIELRCRSDRETIHMERKGAGSPFVSPGQYGEQIAPTMNFFVPCPRRQNHGRG